MSNIKKRFYLTFDAQATTRPLIWEMSKKFDVIFNIRNSSVSNDLGVIALELEGEENEVESAVQWFRKEGLQVDPVELNAIEG